jgi:hypothetical protein
MFQLENDEWDSLRSQIVISSTHGGRRYAPYVFTEQCVSIVKLRHYVFSKKNTNEQITELRKLLMLYIEKNDKRVNDIILVLNNLIGQPPKTRTIGFTAGE